ncbi:DUF6350 family protein [Actinocrispum wychmicini]|uniref:Uncharacterized protein n=1 Tax=Actinocrispum wychmicini TaxID=1213861 RepID=A0A4R2K198_9PSEU|nr:DUF6350 family protein [Actinocrispum wychmicini]TCO65467.1 hypothetical protein EV192_1011259 [Actinocrispum wychmicini]
MSLYPPDLEDVDPDDVTYPDEPVQGRARVLFGAAIAPLLVGYAGTAALLALVISVATRAHFSTGGVLSAAMPGWLGTYQVPLTLGGQHFGALPLLPTIAVALYVGRTAGNAADRLAVIGTRETVPVIATITAAHAVTGFVFAEITSTASVFLSLLVPGLVAAGASVVGLARRGYLGDALGRFDELVVSGLRAGLLGLAALVGIGAALFLLGLATSFATANALFTRGAPGAGNGLGMFLLSAAYVPNAVVGGMAFAVGPGISIGHLTVTPLHFTGGPLPAVPVLAALPESGAGWWPIVVLLPLGVGALVGWVLRDACTDPIARLRAVGAAAVVAAVGCAVLGTGAGGRLANGPFNPLTMHPWSLALAVALWIALPAATVAWWAGPRLALAPSRSLLDDAIEAEDQVDETDEPEPETDEPEPETDEPDVDLEPEPDTAVDSVAVADSAEPDADAGPGEEDQEGNT